MKHFKLRLETQVKNAPETEVIESNTGDEPIRESTDPEGYEIPVTDRGEPETSTQYENATTAEDNPAYVEDETLSWGSDFDDEEESIYEDITYPIHGPDAPLIPPTVKSRRQDDKSQRGTQKPLPQLPEPIYDKIGYDKYWLNQKIRETKKWLIILPMRVIVCIIFLTTLALLYKPYTEQCEPQNSFSEFSLVILSYIILQNLLDTLLAGLSVKAMKKVLASDVFDQIDAMKALKPSKEQEHMITRGTTTYADTDYKALHDTAVMGQKVGTYMKYAHHIAGSFGSEGASAIISRGQVKDAMSVLRERAGKFEGELKNVKLPNLPKTRITNEYIHPNEQLGRSLIGFGGKFLITLNIIPVLSILFFIVVGTDTMTDLHQDGSGKIPTVCKTTIAINWIVVIGIFILNTIRFIPVFFRVIKSANKPRTYIHTTHEVQY